jgi:uncharacterized Zn finger protein
MTTPSISEASIRWQATSQSFSRGERYYWGGAVISLVQRGNGVHAEVQGSQYEPYTVRFTFDDDGVTDVICSCPYDWGGWCKHIVAVMLACHREPDRIDVRPTLDDLLAGLDLEQARGILLHLAANDPHTVALIERQIALSQAASDTSKTDVSPEDALQQRTRIDPGLIRRQVRDVLHSLDGMRRSEAYWHVGSVVDQVRQLLYHVQGFIESGDGRNALVFLEAITEEYVTSWFYLDDSDGFASGFFRELGVAWMEAGRMANDLSTEERERWVQTLSRWQAEIGSYGIDSVFDAAQAAILQG